jgi:glycosyltransferase involved in cell wall biosynthesis
MPTDLRKTNVYYHLSHYISHRKSGTGYIEAIKSLGCRIVKDCQKADVIILHDDPLNYPQIIASLGNPPKERLIAYSVWETEQLPFQYIEPLTLVREIWTCSSFSALSFSKHFQNVKITPHIVCMDLPRPEDLDAAKKMISFTKDSFYFFAVVDSINPRKNLASILDIFIKNFMNSPDVFLVVKQYRQALDLSSLPRVISIDHDLSPGKMMALHAVCDCYISLHHAEAWGLSISDSLAAGKDVIATGYSGNMHYMNENNSYPVAYSIGNIFPEMCHRIPLYTTDMFWGYPNLQHAAYLMKKVVRKGKDPTRASLVRASMQRFSIKNIANIIAKNLSC